MPYAPPDGIPFVVSDTLWRATDMVIIGPLYPLTVLKTLMQYM